jgi:hypothetical protein
MADSISVHTATGQVYSGQCQLTGLIITATAAAGGRATLDDSVGGGGTQLLSIMASAYTPVIIFFRESFYPLFSTGMYLTLAANMTATLWTRQL